MKRILGFSSVFSLVFLFFVSVVTGLPLTSDTSRISPTSLVMASNSALPSEVQAQENASLKFGFDRDTSSELVMFDTGSLKAGFATAESLSAIRVFGPAPYTISVFSRSSSNGSWSSVAGLQNVDLSLLSDQWNTFEPTAQVSATEIRVDVVPQSGGSGSGLSEIEFWSSGQSQAAVTGFDVLTLLGNDEALAQYRHIDASGNTLNVSSGNSSTKTTTFELDYYPGDVKRSWLVYELKGLTHWTAVRRSINGTASLGGHIAAEDKSWSVQVEEIDPQNLLHGTNSISFTQLSGFERDYSVKSIGVLVELFDGHNFLATSNVADGLSATGWSPQAGGTSLEILDLQLEKQAALTELALTLTGTPTGAYTVEALRNGAWVPASNVDIDLMTSSTVTIVGSTFTIPLDDTASDGLRIAVANAGGAAFEITEAQVTGSGTSGPYDPPSININWPQNGEFYGRTAFFRGFVLPETNASGAAELYVAGYPATITNGTFEVAISKDQAGFAAQADTDDWTVDVSAIYPDGTVATHLVTLNNPVVDENIAAYAPQTFAQMFVAGQDTTVNHDEAELTVAAASLSQDAEIRITPLRDIELAKLDAGLINVTKGPRAGYRMLPHQKFNADVDLTLPFNAKRIPRGYTEGDVRLYYFDEDAGHWMALNDNTIDAATGHVTGKTKHFTDFIAGVVVAPESPQVASFNPTQLKDIKVADPSAKINLISVPKGSNTGDASLSYPIELPPGRLGMAPQLGLQYSSGAQNGWMGMGWNISMQEISIDTRWGVPRYDDASETETYVIAGQQLTPVAHRGALVPRVAEREFHQRIEGSFNKIIRHGDNPDNYWWEVTDKMGTRYAYGGNLDSGAQDSSAILADDAGNAYKWALTETRDTNGNRVTYDYLSVATPGLKLGTLDGRNLYCDTIRYTGHGATDGPFEVQFIRDRQQPAFSERNDTIIDGRGGFKMVTADLLKRIEVSYLGVQVRAYEFDYAEGAFHKNLLQSVTQLDATDAAFNTHTFDYFDDARTAGVYKGFASATDWTSPNDNVELSAFGVITQDASALGASEGSNGGGHLYVGFGFFVSGKQGTIGPKFGGGSGESMGRLALVDLDGDGLSDKVFIGSGGIFYRKNISGPNGTLAFDNTPIQVATLPAISQESNSMFSAGLEGYFGVNFGLNWSDSVSSSETYFTDANGDGLPDLVHQGSVLFNHLDTAGVPTFDTDSSLSPFPVGPAAVDAAVLTADFDALYQDLVDNTPLVDTVRSWTAPFAGMVAVSGDVALIEDTSPERAAYPTADGVRVAIEHAGISLWSIDILETDYTSKTPTVGSVTVAKGETLYFRVQSLFDGAYDQVSWDPAVSYVSVTPTTDANGLDVYNYQASADFVLAGTPQAAVAAPFNGTVLVSGSFEKPVQTTDDVTVEVLKNNVLVSTQTLAWNQTGTISVSESLSVLKSEFDAGGVQTQVGDIISIRTLVDSRIDLSNIGWSQVSPPKMVYTASADPLLPQVNNTFGDPLVDIALVATPESYPETNLVSPATAWTATETGVYTVLPQISLVGGSVFDGDIVATVKSNGQLVTKGVISFVSGAAVPATFPLNTTVGTDYFLEYSSAVPGALDEISVVSFDLTAPSLIVTSQSAPAYAAQSQGQITPSYRGWTGFGYNGNRLRADQPIDLSNANLDLTPAEIAAIQADIQAGIDAGVRDDALVQSYEQIVFPLMADAELARLSGTDDNVWLAGDTASSSRQGVDFVSVPDVSVFAGASGIPRVSKTDTFAANAGVSIIGGNVAESTTRSVLDYLDLNGDRFPDVLSSSAMVQFSPMIGGLEGSAMAMPNMGADVRETDGDSFGIGINGNYSIQAGNPQGRVDQTVGSGNSGETGPQMPSIGFGGSVGSGNSDISYDLRDINADGLPDLVRRVGSNLRVRFNFGYAFSAVEETYGLAQINDGESDTLSVNFGFNDGIYGFGGGVSASTTTSNSFDSLADMNGDGLLDSVSVGSASASTILVGLNTGSGFEPAINWPTGGQPHGVSNSKSLNAGLSGYITIPLFVVAINPGGNVGQNMSRLETSIQDIDGDGFPDYLHSEDDDELRVSLSTTGRTNLLKSVNRPLGSTIALSYERNGNTYDQPQNRWVLNRVEVFDGHTGDGEDLLITEYDYLDGMYDREEREFYGYASVIERQMNNNGAGADTVYRVVTRTFSNDSYYSKGLMLSSTTDDALGARFLETSSLFDLVDIDTGTTVADPQSLVATVFPQLVRSDSQFFEGQPVAGKATFSTFDYDALGNVIRFFDAANLNTALDDVESNIEYHSDLAAYIVGKADRVTVIGNSAIMRERQAAFAPGTGNLTQLNVLLAGGGSATSDMVYDGFGNLTQMTGPTNATSQRYQLNYTFDTAVNTYVESISDSFGYVSAATYDLRYGELLSTLDLNAQPMAYTLDDVGRIVSVQGPYQAGTGFDTITFAYNPVRDVPGDGQYPNVITSWALTDHIDTYRNISDPIQTALFIDGLGRAIQTKKDAAIFENGARVDSMVASGRVVFDHVGRQVEQYYPTEEPLGQPGTFNATFDGITPTLTSYDVLDRPVDVTIPDGAATLMTYDFGADRNGTTQFRTSFTDAEGKQRETFADVRKLLTSVKEINPAGGQPTIWTSYTYDPLRQITEVLDDQDNLTTAAYDNFGRMIQLDNPDTGATSYTFDLASNLIAKETANLTASGGQIDYTYDFQRLMAVSYPDYPGNNVAYTYGGPGEAGNRANRIMTVTSQGGSEDRFYGPLGELTQVTKTIASDTQGNGPNSAEVYTSEFTYDTWNRLQSMTYPDGEVLTNAYDSGGKLRQIDATKAGYDYAYLRDLGYDKFGQRTYLLAGNNTETTYAYTPDTRRLDGLVAGNSQGRTFQDLAYDYDLVGNITAQANSAAVVGSSQLGGATSFTYAYDDLYRLTGATGVWEYAPNKTESFTLDMSYDSIHNITLKDQLHLANTPGGTSITQQKTSYDWAYAYAGAQPHGASQIGDRAFSYDLNGNQTGWDNLNNGTNRTIEWDEENRIQSVADNGHTMTYKYDDAGERVIKRGPQGETAYVSQFYTVRNREVGTKHVFAGGTRLVSKMVKLPKDLDLDGVEDPLANDCSEPWGWTNGQGQGLGHANGNGPCANNGVGVGNTGGGGAVFEKDQYFYHPDHLGSSSYVTDVDGEIFQHLEYFPFGETWVEESSNTQRTPYLFTGKELDEETGLYYFGARYYDPRTSVWQSPDPILASYMRGQRSGGGVFLPVNLNLFGYVHQRPIIAVDPNGKETIAEYWAGLRNPFTARRMQMGTSPVTRTDGTIANVPSGTTIGTIAARWAYTGATEAQDSIFSKEFGNKASAGGQPYRAGSQNAVRHIVLSAFSHNELGDSSGVDTILSAHESEFLDLDTAQRVFETGMEADSVADRLNNEIGKVIAGNGGQSRKDVLTGIAVHGRNVGFWQVRTDSKGMREVYQSRLTETQYQGFLEAIAGRDDNAMWPDTAE